MRVIFLFVLISSLFSSCVEIEKKFTKLPPGKWRAVLEIDKDASTLSAVGDEEVSIKTGSEGELPFQFEVVYDNETDFHIELINGEERIVADEIVYGLDRATAKDTIEIHFPVFDTYIKAIYEEDIIEGHWFVNYKDNYRIPFKAYHGQNHRFTTLKKEPAADLSGKWEVTFGVGTENPYPAIGEFVQKGNQLSGTFLTETGDYRFLDGTIQGNKAYLSCFDGSHAFLFEAKLLEDGTLTGIFRSGKHYTNSWEAKRNPDFQLGDAFELTRSVSEEALDFSFENEKGELISLSDDRYKNKIKLVKIMGTWCPNCKDEANFLLEYLEKEKPEDVEVIAISFERYREDEKSKAAIARFKEKMNIPFEVLYGGYFSKSEASEKLPAISKVLSYPTLLFVDRENMIRKIHTGFSGPATSEYADFKKEFYEVIERLRT